MAKLETKKQNSNTDLSGKLLKAYPAEIVELIGREGTKQVVTLVRCKVLDGKDSGKIMRRNVYGPTRIGDIIMLTQTEIEASSKRGSRK
jgi:small subunit ribosomal protein S28e